MRECSRSPKPKGIIAIDDRGAGKKGTYRIRIEVVDSTSTSDDNGNTSNGVNDSLVLRNPVGYTIQKPR